MDVSILNTLLNLIVDALVAALIDGVPESDTSRAGIVRAGRLLDDPTRGRINVLVHPNDPVDDRGFRHTLANWYENADLAFTAPTWEIGGGAYYWRKFTVELEIFFRRTDRDTASAIAHVVLSRAEHVLFHLSMPQDIDDFGERAVGPSVVYDSYLRGGGGEGDFNWKGNIHAMIRTSKD